MPSLEVKETVKNHKYDTNKLIEQSEKNTNQKIEKITNDQNDKINELKDMINQLKENPPKPNQLDPHEYPIPLSSNYRPLNKPTMAEKTKIVPNPMINQETKKIARKC